MIDLWWVSLAGAAGTFHCLGMCSVFALSLAPSRTARWKTVARQLIYNSGRVVTYCFLGVMAGVLGHFAIGAGPVGMAQRLLALASGLLMIVMALQLFGYRIPWQLGTGGGMGSVLRGVRGLLGAPGAAAPLAFGVFNGLLPCPLVYAFVARAVGTGSISGGLLTMAAFGLGTFPTMLAVGLLGFTLSPRLRSAGMRIAGVFIVLFGLITIARGLYPTMPMMHMTHATDHAMDHATDP